MSELACVACGNACRPIDRFCSQCGERDPLRLHGEDATPGRHGDRTARWSVPLPDQPPETMLAAGARFAGRYRIERLLGEGGMGRVYIAQDGIIDERLALKVLSLRYSRDEALLEQFQRELKLARRVRQRNVVRTYDLGRAGDACYVSMEYVDAENLWALLARRGALSESEALRILRQLLEGLRAVHALGILHRELKAGNVLVNADRVAFITDLGLATPARLVPRIQGSTPVFMAPEQFLGMAASEATDLYACGVLLQLMLTGRPPFPWSGYVPLRHAHLYTAPQPIPDAAATAPTRQLVAELLRKDPGSRPLPASLVLGRVNAIMAIDSLTVRTQDPIALVVEEDAPARALCAEALSRSGLHVLEAGDTRSAVALAFANPVSVVIVSGTVRGSLAFDPESDPVLSSLDPSLPGLESLAFCRILGADDRLRDVPVLVTAAEGDSALREALALVGAAGVVTAPYGAEEIARAVAAARSAARLEGGAGRAEA